MIEFGRDICGELSNAERREWLVTNGIGGYASGTLAGLLTRRYHGLLVAALQPPVGRTLLVSKLDEMARYGGNDYALFANRWQGGAVNPHGYRYVERFHLEGTTPVWTFALADALLEKRIWMQPGANTTYVRYDLGRASAPLTLTAKALVNFRDFHGEMHASDWRMGVEQVAEGLKVTPYEGAVSFYLLAEGAGAVATPKHDWYANFALAVEAYRGFNGVEDHLYVGDLLLELQAGESLTIVLSTEGSPNLNGDTAYAQRMAYERQLLKKAGQANPQQMQHPAIQQLILAADQFIVKRSVPHSFERLEDGKARPLSPSPSLPLAEGRSIIAGYHWFGDWGRDTMIALPGLTLTTGRADIAANILRTFAHFVESGMLPNRFPDVGEEPEYNTVDATLWYFEAIRAYHETTGDNDSVRELFPVLQEIIDWHQRGTRYHIHVDPSDNLIYAGEAGVQLTWMDAKVGDWVVTPRIGKPIEINALWYNALCSMADFANLLGQDSSPYDQLASQVKRGFSRFWHNDLGYCVDVLDTSEGNDASLRPNQLFAVSLHHSPLSKAQQKSVVDTCARHLLTSHGMRSLSPTDAAYIGDYGGDSLKRDGSYHQGTVWGWLIGTFAEAHLRVYNDPNQTRTFLKPLLQHLNDHGLGSISEIFDGNPPFTPRGCIAQAWSVAEVLRLWGMLAE